MYVHHHWPMSIMPFTNGKLKLTFIDTSPFYANIWKFYHPL